MCKWPFSGNGTEKFVITCVQSFSAKLLMFWRTKCKEIMVFLITVLIESLNEYFKMNSGVFLNLMSDIITHRTFQLCFNTCIYLQMWAREE